MVGKVFLHHWKEEEEEETGCPETPLNSQNNFHKALTEEVRHYFNAFNHLSGDFSASPVHTDKSGCMQLSPV